MAAELSTESVVEAVAAAWGRRNVGYSQGRQRC